MLRLGLALGYALPCALSLALTIGCGGSAPTPPARTPAPLETPMDRAAIEHAVRAELDDFHDAAAKADEPRYFAHFAPSGIFLGTDKTERWDVAAFRAYAHEHFAKGHGWTYRVVRRAVDPSTDGRVAWFDEDLVGERAGDCRGSGVLVREARSGRWLIAQYNLTFTVPNDKLAAMRAAIDGPATSDIKTRFKAGYQEATQAAVAGDLANARAKLTAVLDAIHERAHAEDEFWLHNDLTWVRWAEGDLDAALAEVGFARATLDHAQLPADKDRALRLHERWDRAYLLLEIALKAKKDRARAMSAADAARAEYEALAKPANDHDGMAVLTTFFAARKGDGRAAAAAAKTVDIAKDSDLQDLYVIALGFDAAGDHAAADGVRARICGGEPYLMKPLIVRAMTAEGHGCPVK